MRSRAVRVAMIVFQAVWLNAVLPGHTRGVVTLPGGAEDCSSCAAPASAGAGHCCPGDGARRGQPPMAPGRAGRCALCHLAARLTIPPAIDLRPPALQLAEVRPAQPKPHCVSLPLP